MQKMTTTIKNYPLPRFAWRRVLFCLSLSLSCGLFWSCSLPLQLSAPFFSLLALLACALFARCSSFRENADPNFSNYNTFDAFVINWNEKNQIYLNNGSGGFTAPTLPSSFPANYSRRAALGDLDGDGDLDAFVTTNFSAANQIYLNDGSGGFTVPTPRSNFPTNNSEEAALGDLDGDGDLDAFVANYGGANQIYLNDGSGGFTAPTPPSNFLAKDSYGVALGDLDGDGDLDAFVTNRNAANQIYLNDGSGSFTVPTPPSSFPAHFSRGVALGDLDGDGDLDAFVTNRNNEENRIYLNDGSGVFTAPTPPSSFPANNSRGVALGDLDGDGDLDAFVTNYNNQENQVYLNDGSGGFTAPTPPSSFPAKDSRGVALGDLDGDGDLDAFVTNYSQANQIYLNDGSGGFTAPTHSFPANNSIGIALGDLD